MRLLHRDADGPASVERVELRAEDVSKELGGSWMLAPTDLSVDSGECVVVTGPNGSGKTTLLRIISGQLQPTTGSVTINGHGVDERAPWTRRTMTSLIGAPAVYRDLTLADHLVLIATTWSVPAREVIDRVTVALEQWGIGSLYQRFPHELSSGQQQLFHLSMALLKPSRVLVMDEPEQRLDVGKRRLLAQVLLEHKAAGTALVIASHDPQLTAAIADAELPIDAE